MASASHLVASAAQALELSDEARIERIRLVKAAWIPYTLAKNAVDQLCEMIAEPRQERPWNLLIIGDANNGKSRILSRVCELNPINPNLRGPAIIATVVRVEVTEPSLSEFYSAILTALNAPFRVGDRKEVKQFQSMQLLRQCGTRLLLMDELNNAIAGPYLRQKQFMTALRVLSNELRLPIGAAGTKEVQSALMSDPQMNERFKKMELPLWHKDNEYKQLLASFEKLLPLKKPSDLQQKQLADKLLIMSGHRLGDISEILRTAAIMAVRNKEEQITLELLQNLKSIPRPTERPQG